MSRRLESEDRRPRIVKLDLDGIVVAQTGEVFANWSQI